MDTTLEKIVIFWLTNVNFLDKRAEIISKFDTDLFTDSDLKHIFEEHIKAYNGQKMAFFNELKMLECMADSLGWQPYNLDFVISELRKQKVEGLLKDKLAGVITDPNESHMLQEIEKITGECSKLLQQEEKTAVKDILTDVLEERETEQEKGIFTGITELDKETKRLRAGHFWIIGGYTNVGKTGMMLQLINNVCLAGHSAVLFTLEMTSVDLVNRLLQFNEYKLKNHAQAIDRVADFKFEIYSRKRKLQDIIRTLRAKKPLPPVVFVDFLQLIQVEGKTEYERVTKIAQELQDIAKELKVCIVALSQVSNEGAKATDSVVISFKGSGALAIACDVGIELTRKKEMKDGLERDEILMNCRKNRHGRRPQETYDFDKNSGFILFN